MNKYKKAKTIAAVVTLIIHIALILLLLNIYLMREVPQDEEGLEVMFGMSDDGGDDLFEPTPAEEIGEQLAQDEPSTPPEAEVEPSEEAHQTQDIEESVQMKKEKSEEEIKREKEIAEQKRIEKQKQLEEQRKLAEEQRKKAEEQRKRDSIANAISQRTAKGFGGNGTTNGATGTGGGSTSGSKGNPFGSNTSTNTEGSAASGNNNSFSLSGRSVRGNIVRPNNNEQVEGKIIVSITVDKDGNVIEAHHVTKGSTVDNARVINDAVAAAKRTKFSSTTENKNQVGQIIYDFKLK